MAEKNEQCLNCEYAVWDRTNGGQPSPSGSGKCVYEPKMPDIPAAKYVVSELAVYGGYINRREPLKKQCKCQWLINK